MSKNDKHKSELLKAVMEEVDDRIRVTRGYNSDKIIIKEAENDGNEIASVGRKKEDEKNPEGKQRFLEATNASGKTVKIRRPAEEQQVDSDKKREAKMELHINENRLLAHIMVHKKSSGPYTRDEIIQYLASNGIVAGLHEKNLEKIVAGECYYEEVEIARGTASVKGKDGYYEYHFNTSPEMKPIILPDGSVDYNTLGKMELVVKDQLLVTYHPALSRVDGMDIFGNQLRAEDGKELPSLQGKGFEYDAKYNEYYAAMEGKVTLEGNSLNVVPVFIVEGNLEAATGDVTFHGDVVVRGNVFSNVTLKTTGSITVEGHVEIATLIAGKDVLLKNGMQGSGIGRIYAKGNVMAKFLEQTNVQAKGNISANAILNCNVEAGQSVIVSGTRGAILGGTVSAVEQISAYSLGNRVGISTKIILGLEEDFKTFMGQLEKRIEDCQKDIQEAEVRLERVIYQLRSSKSPALLADRDKYAQEKAKLQTTLNSLLAKQESAADIRERSANGKIVISGPVNIGCLIIMNGVSELLTSERKNVTITRAQKELRILSNTIDMKKPK